MFPSCKGRVRRRQPREPWSSATTASLSASCHAGVVVTKDRSYRRRGPKPAEVLPWTLDRDIVSVASPAAERVLEILLRQRLITPS